VTRKSDLHRSLLLVQRLDPPFEEPDGEAMRLFGQRVREVRKKLELTLEQASERADLSAKFVGEVERGMRRPSFESILALARALNVAPVTFFQLEEAGVHGTAVRQRIEEVLAGCTAEQLQQAYRILRAIVES
jgi:transcriptional regulator with XRE-family HTH domain